MTTLAVDWAAAAQQITTVRAADRQVKSIAPDLGISDPDQRILAMAHEMTLAHAAGAIDLDGPDFEHASGVIFESLAEIENTYAVTIFVNDRES